MISGIELHSTKFIEHIQCAKQYGAKKSTITKKDVVVDCRLIEGENEVFHFLCHPTAPQGAFFIKHMIDA